MEKGSAGQSSMTRLHGRRPMRIVSCMTRVYGKKIFAGFHTWGAGVSLAEQHPRDYGGAAYQVRGLTGAYRRSVCAVR